MSFRSGKIFWKTWFPLLIGEMRIPIEMRGFVVVSQRRRRTIHGSIDRGSKGLSRRINLRSAERGSERGSDGRGIGTDRRKRTELLQKERTNEQPATCNNERTQGVKGNGRGGGFAAVGWSVPVPDSRSREHGKDERDTILS